MAYDSESKPVNADLLILQRARDRVAKGWRQARREYGGEVCIVGALEYAMFGAHDVSGGNIYIQVGTGAHQLGFADGDEASHWNDAKGRTQTEVLARFDQAIDRLARS